MLHRSRIASALFILAPSLAYAQNPSLIPSSGTIGSCNFLTGDIHASCVVEYLQYLIGLIFMFIGAFFLLMIIVAGYQIAIGSFTGQKEAGFERLRWAIIGFMISALSFAIISFVIGALSGT
ncbi:hypothetical protein COU80_03030 [Candidatus Peregrinibacteria bacterium CG10_big_fil_rev_8_21_14_0_10_55_24]|nr:MAG: hypothetical protein COU80_03030 [Candidatus Peregrinibacteria bacterium CG10_big_fil_rev_8_21_14_0_10_55_24]